MLKHSSVTSRADNRPSQLSSVSANALAMTPRNKGIAIDGWERYQLNPMLPASAIRTRRL